MLIVSNKLAYLSENICKQSVKGVVWLLFAVIIKHRKKDNSNKNLLSKTEPELDILENYQPIFLSKDAQSCFGENDKNEEDDLVAGDIRYVTYGSNKSIAEAKNRDEVA